MGYEGRHASPLKTIQIYPVVCKLTLQFLSLLHVFDLLVSSVSVVVVSFNELHSLGHIELNFTIIIIMYDTDINVVVCVVVSYVPCHGSHVRPTQREDRDEERQTG